MDITPSNIASMFFGFGATFSQAYSSTEVWAPRLAMMPTYGNVSSVVNGWMDKIPILREWVGERHIQNVALRGRTMSPLPFELTVGVDRYQIEDDAYGLYGPAVAMMGEQAAKWGDREIAKLILANPTGFDGVSFFNDAHPVDIDAGAAGPYGTYDNNLALALTATNFGLARTAMRGFKGRDGQPMGIRPSLLVVPPSLEDTANRIMTSDYLASFVMGNSTAGNVAAEPNIYKGACEVLVIDELESDPTAWYLLDNRKAIKPFLWWQRQAPQFVYKNKPDDDRVFFTREFLFGLDCRGVADVTLPFLALKSKP